MEKLERKGLKPYLVTLGLMVVTSLALAYSVDVTVTDKAGVSLELPDQVGVWQGDEIRFCLTDTCKVSRAGAVLLSTLNGVDVCAVCGEKLSPLQQVEVENLPHDTRAIRKIYRGPVGSNSFNVAIVLSGRERASIHRPENCLGGSSAINRSEIIEVPLPGRDPLRVKVLHLNARRNATGQLMEPESFYAYWFVGKDRETPSHVQRMIWMATDRIFRNVAHRWAYIAVSGIHDPKDTDNAYIDQLKTFIAQLYPKILSQPVKPTD
jgi:hypothetical protein